MSVTVPAGFRAAGVAAGLKASGAPDVALVVNDGPLDAAAKKHGATTAQLSLAWLLYRSPVMLPIPGTSSVKHLEENVAAASLKLDASEWQAIEADAKKK